MKKLKKLNIWNIYSKQDIPTRLIMYEGKYCVCEECHVVYTGDDCPVCSGDGPIGILPTVEQVAEALYAIRTTRYCGFPLKNSYQEMVYYIFAALKTIDGSATVRDNTPPAVLAYAEAVATAINATAETSVPEKLLQELTGDTVSVERTVELGPMGFTVAFTITVKGDQDIALKVVDANLLDDVFSKAHSLMPVLPDLPDDDDVFVDVDGDML